MKKVALIGASGYVGSAVLNELLHRGYKLLALVRHPEKITIKNEHLEVKRCDVLDEASLENAISGIDIVVSAYNAGWTNPNLYDEFMNGAKHIISACKKANIQQLFVIGGAGSLYISPGLQGVDAPGFPAEWKPGALAARDFLKLLKSDHKLNWTFLSPSINMFPGPRTGKYRTGLDEPVMNAEGKSEISVQDLSVAVADELENKKFTGKRFTVGY